MRNYSLFPVLRGEGGGDGGATRGRRKRGRFNGLKRATATRAHTHATPLPNPLPGVPGRGSRNVLATSHANRTFSGIFETARASLPTAMMSFSFRGVLAATALPFSSV